MRDFFQPRNARTLNRIWYKELHVRLGKKKPAEETQLSPEPKREIISVIEETTNQEMPELPKERVPTLEIVCWMHAI